MDKETWYKKCGQDSVVAIKKDAVLPPSARNLRFLRQGALLQKLAASTLRDSWAPVAPCFLGGLPACRTGDVAEVLRGVAQVAATWSRLEWRAVLGAADVHRAYDSVPLRATADPLRTMVWEAQDVFGGPLLQGGVRLAHDDLGRLLRPDIGVRTGAVESNQLLAQLLDRVLRPLLGAWAEREWSFWSSKEGRRCLCG